jgi:hypothetical protein
MSKLLDEGYAENDFGYLSSHDDYEIRFLENKFYDQDFFLCSKPSKN